MDETQIDDPYDSPLDAEQIAVLEFACEHIRPHEDLVKEKFHISVIRYYQILNSLIDHPDAYRLYPTLIKRLTDLREQRRRSRRVRSMPRTV